MNPEFKEASETPSPDTESSIEEQIEFDFYPEEEVIEVGNTKIIFREPTEEELPTREVPRADTGFIGQDFFGEGEQWVATTIGKSPTGNELQVTKRREGTGYVLRWSKRGELAAKFSGWYTTYEKAEEAARLLLSLMWEDARKAG